MKRKMFIQCSYCGYHFEASPMLGIPEGMYYNGYRAVGDALYCPECVKTWKDRNGEEFDEQYKNPSKMFANWWNNKVNAFVDDKASIKTYRIVNGFYEELPKSTDKHDVTDKYVGGKHLRDNTKMVEKGGADNRKK